MAGRWEEGTGAGKGASPMRAAMTSAAFQCELMARSEASSLFGNPRGDALDSILGSARQTMFGEPLDRSREERAANLLHLVVRTIPSPTATSASASCRSCPTRSRRAWSTGSTPRR